MKSNILKIDQTFITVDVSTETDLYCFAPARGGASGGAVSAENNYCYSSYLEVSSIYNSVWNLIQRRRRRWRRAVMIKQRATSLPAHL